MTPTGDITEEMLAALAWQIELGATEAIADTPQDRFAESKPKPHSASLATSTTAEDPRGRGGAIGAAVDARPASAPDPTTPLAASANSLEELAEVMRNWEGSTLKAGARSFVFSDGLPGARLMVIGEAPGAEEDRQGKPFVGRAGQLLDRMLDAIGLSRTAPAPESAVYITNILPWRPPGNRTPSEQEAATFLPFVIRHIQLAIPDIVLTMGNTPTKPPLSTTTGIKRMRGRWVRHEPTGLPLIPSFHPAYLLRQPADKRLAWHDLIAVRQALDGKPPV